jgi:hypothetical protein
MLLRIVKAFTETVSIDFLSSVLSAADVECAQHFQVLAVLLPIMLLLAPVLAQFEIDAKPWEQCGGKSLVSGGPKHPKKDAQFANCDGTCARKDAW